MGRFIPSRLVCRIWPRYGLPDCVILKKLRKPEHVEAFEDEKTFYRRLEAAQCDLIPRYYGEGVSDGDRTNVIEYLPWPTVMAQPLPRISAEEFSERITVATDELARYGGVYYDDSKLNNILLADDGRIIFIDLEGLVETEPGMEAYYRKYTIMSGIPVPGEIDFIYATADLAADNIYDGIVDICVRRPDHCIVPGGTTRMRTQMSAIPMQPYDMGLMYTRHLTIVVSGM
ncbi:hypothetical protein SCUCBS95973_004774 [Sporothrix curviconia]|uniref:Protein kinase domain-containing protein n=1 Tax=Sporothrix curviconia TaxID=1260050 RepID=A0ABP0BRE3_9PEZI